MQTVNIYHEKQVRELCALHALNNLFQARETFTKAELDIICHSLSPDVWINPHKSILGLGNYDINVIMKALQEKSHSAIWYDRRKDPTCLCLKNIFGFILNVPSDYKFSFVTLPLRRRHWIAVRRIGGAYYNLDSKLNAPQLIGKGCDLVEYLKDELESKDKQIFIVVTNQVDRNESWLQHKLNSNLYLEERDSEIMDLEDIISDGVNITINPLCSSQDL